MAMACVCFRRENVSPGLNCRPRGLGLVKRVVAAHNGGMSTTPNHLPSHQRDKALNELLLKGIFIALIGLVLLLAPSIMAAGEVRTLVAGSSLVAWFALVLGLALIVRYVLRRRAAK